MMINENFVTIKYIDVHKQHDFNPQIVSNE